MESASGVGRTDGARTEKVGELMREAVETGECPFCGDLGSNKPAFSYDTFEHWRVFYNMSPMPGTAQHIMIVSNQHTLFWHNVIRAARIEYGLIVQRLKDRFGETFTTLMRLGLPEYNSATVYHLHAHFMVPGQAPSIPEEHRPFCHQMRIFSFQAVQEFCAELDILRTIELSDTTGQLKAWPVRLFAFDALRPKGELTGEYGLWDAQYVGADSTIQEGGIALRGFVTPKPGADPWSDEVNDDLAYMIGTIETEWPQSLSVLMRHTPDGLHYDMVTGTTFAPSVHEVNPLTVGLYERIKDAAVQLGKDPLEFVDAVRQSLLWNAAPPRSAVQVKLSNLASSL